jgi:hypothetical protein
MKVTLCKFCTPCALSSNLSRYRITTPLFKLLFRLLQLRLLVGGCNDDTNTYVKKRLSSTRKQF